MFYDRYSEKNDLIVFGHMCNLKVETEKLSELFYFLSDNKIRATLSFALFDNYFYISLFFRTEKLAQEAFNTLSEWNP